MWHRQCIFALSNKRIQLGDNIPLSLMNSCNTKHVREICISSYKTAVKNRNMDSLLKIKIYCIVKKIAAGPVKCTAANIQNIDKKRKKYINNVTQQINI